MRMAIQCASCATQCSPLLCHLGKASRKECNDFKEGHSLTEPAGPILEEHHAWVHYAIAWDDVLHLRAHDLLHTVAVHPSAIAFVAHHGACKVMHPRAWRLVYCSV